MKRTRLLLGMSRLVVQQSNRRRQAADERAEGTASRTRRRLRPPYLSGGLLAICLAVPWVGSAQPFSVDWFKVSAGGGNSTGGVYMASGTIGQADAGALNGGNYALTGGFWSLVAAVQAPGAPRLTIGRSGTRVVLSWPYPSTGFNLQQSGGLGASGWVAASGATQAGTNWQLTITTPAGRQFYRLRSQ